MNPMTNKDGNTDALESLSARFLSGHMALRKTCKSGPTAGERASELQHAWIPARALQFDVPELAGTGHRTKEMLCPDAKSGDPAKFRTDMGVEHPGITLPHAWEAVMPEGLTSLQAPALANAVSAPRCD